MNLPREKVRFLTPRILLVGFSLISLLICAWAAAAHYRKLAWGDPWQPIGWLLSMFFLLSGNLSAVADSWLVPKQNVPPDGRASSKASSPVPQLVRQLYLTLLRAVAVSLQSLISNSISVSELIVSAPLIIFERMKRGRALVSSSTLPR